MWWEWALLHMRLCSGPLVLGYGRVADPLGFGSSRGSWQHFLDPLHVQGWWLVLQVFLQASWLDIWARHTAYGGFVAGSRDEPAVGLHPAKLLENIWRPTRGSEVGSLPARSCWSRVDDSLHLRAGEAGGRWSPYGATRELRTRLPLFSVPFFSRAFAVTSLQFLLKDTRGLVLCDF